MGVRRKGEGRSRTGKNCFSFAILAQVLGFCRHHFYTILDTWAVSYIQGWPKRFAWVSLLRCKGKPKWTFWPTQYTAKDDGKARRRKKMGMVTSEAEEVRLLILRTLIPLSCCPPLHQVSFAQVAGWGGGWTWVGWESMSYQHFYQTKLRGPAEATTDAWGLRERSVP